MDAIWPFTHFLEVRSKGFCSVQHDFRSVPLPYHGCMFPCSIVERVGDTRVVQYMYICNTVVIRNGNLRLLN